MDQSHISVNLYLYVREKVTARARQFFFFYLFIFLPPFLFPKHRMKGQTTLLRIHHQNGYGALSSTSKPSGSDGRRAPPARSPRSPAPAGFSLTWLPWPPPGPKGQRWHLSAIQLPLQKYGFPSFG